ncbi:hypothetical protein KBD81_05935, partial [Candidatus Woesebacteria bacterium]|nr:hypothetical protein [Candidatus Woesebacteria bacterium]
DIDWGEGTNPNQLAYVKYQPNFMEGQGSLFCMKFRALSVGEDGWSIRFRYNDWPSSWMDFQTGTMTVVPTPIYLPAVSR